MPEVKKNFGGIHLPNYSPVSFTWFLIPVQEMWDNFKPV